MHHIHVAIPSYNNAEGLSVLLPSLLQQNFASITVLDDASTDNTSEILTKFPCVKCVRSEVNLGTVGANNLILRNMPTDGFLLCIDSDMEVVTENIPEVLSDFIDRHPNVGAGVGKMVDIAGKRVRWNFNYDINPWRSLFAFLTYHPARLLDNVPYLGGVLKRISLLFTQHLAEDVEQKIDWGIEGFFFVRTDLWSLLHGFDSRFKRFHEGPDLFLQIRKMGYQCWYVPAVLVQDHNQASGTTWYRKYHYLRSLVIYFFKNPSRLFIYRWPRP